MVGMGELAAGLGSAKKAIRPSARAARGSEGLRRGCDSEARAAPGGQAGVNEVGDTTGTQQRGADAAWDRRQPTSLVFAWPRGIRWFWSGGRFGGLLVIHQDTVRIALEVVELTAACGPEQDADRDQAEDQHARDQTVDDFHRDGGRQDAPWDDPGRSRNRLWIRAELAITARELSGMDTAATRGVTSAAMANGTMMTL